MKRATKTSARAAPRPKKAPEKSAEPFHALKAWPDTFVPIYEGRRTFDIRLNDRHFKEGDLIEYREWDETKKEATGRTIRKRIAYLLRGMDESACHPLSQPRWGLKGSYVAMGLASLTPSS